MDHCVCVFIYTGVVSVEATAISISLKRDLQVVERDHVGSKLESSP